MGRGIIWGPGNPHDPIPLLNSIGGPAKDYWGGDPGLILYKYTEKEWALGMIQKGEFKIGTLYDY